MWSPGTTKCTWGDKTKSKYENINSKEKQQLMTHPENRSSTLQHGKSLKIVELKLKN